MRRLHPREGRRRPRIIAFIPTHNEAGEVGPAIESLLNQTRRLDQIIVMPNGCVDARRRVPLHRQAQGPVLPGTEGGPDDVARSRHGWRAAQSRPFWSGREGTGSVSTPGTYAVILRRIEGNDHDGFRTASYWDGRLHPVRELAVNHGFRTVRCDDFNVGMVRDGRLVSLWWMDKVISEDEGTLDGIGRECGRWRERRPIVTCRGCPLAAMCVR